MTPEDYPGRGDLPDRLAFVKPRRARAYIALAEAEQPLTATELTDRLDCSKATVYRCLNALEELDLVTDTTRLTDDVPQRAAYEPTADAAVANGGERQ